MTKDRFNTPTTEKTKEEWLTPPHIIQALGQFDLDPCAPHRDRRQWDTADRHFTGPRDLFDSPDNDEARCGLNEPWHGRVWLNPPYGDETFIWLSKLAAHRRGVALIFARTETQGFHREIWEKAAGVFFFEGRLSFYHVDGTLGDSANAPSCLVAYSEEDCQAIQASGLRGKFVRLI